MRRFLPLILPILAVTGFAALSYGFWKKNSIGVKLVDLPSMIVDGENVTLSHPAGKLPEDPGFSWRVTVSKDSMARLGPLELAYGTGELAPDAAAWIPLPTGSAFGTFWATPKLPEGDRGSLRLWVRGRNGFSQQPIPTRDLENPSATKP